MIALRVGAAVFAILVLFIGGSLWYAYHVRGSADLRFSTTMEWGEEFVTAATATPVFLPADWRAAIHIPTFPANTSTETRNELQTLVSYKQLRIPEKIADIKIEDDLDFADFGGRPIRDYFDEQKFPHTARLLRGAFDDLFIVIFTLKKEFDRVRPSLLEPAIEPVIDIPRHAAYPSGHATQAYFLAFLLSELDPARKAIFEERAFEIARNREIAGVHYQSDSAAGKELARQLLSLMHTSPAFEERVERARSEW